MPLPFIASAALKLAPLAMGLFNGHQHHRGFDSADIMKYRPQGWTTPEDEAAAGRTQTRLGDAAQATAAQQNIDIKRRAQARGLDGSPIMEGSLARVGEGLAVGKEHAATAASDQLYALKLARERMDFQKFGMAAGAANADQSRNDLKHSTWANSMLEYIPAMMGGGLGGGAGAAGAAVGAGTGAWNAGSGAFDSAADGLD